MPPAFSKPPERVLSLPFPPGHDMRRQLRRRVPVAKQVPMTRTAANAASSEEIMTACTV